MDRFPDGANVLAKGTKEPGIFFGTCQDFSHDTIPTTSYVYELLRVCSIWCRTTTYAALRAMASNHCAKKQYALCAAKRLSEAVIEQFWTSRGLKDIPRPCGYQVGLQMRPFQFSVSLSGTQDRFRGTSTFTEHHHRADGGGSCQQADQDSLSSARKWPKWALVTNSRKASTFRSLLSQRLPTYLAEC